MLYDRNMSVLQLFFVITISLFSYNLNNEVEVKVTNNGVQESDVKCTENGCFGAYKGSEFINGADVAHQFSNTMSKAVGDKLKELYSLKKFKKVDFTNIVMSTKGMGSGRVTFELHIAFVKVSSKCEAFTSFDHVGGWNHSPALERRKKELANVLMKNHKLNISDLKTTPEGLQEYWIQWKNKKTQAECQ